MNSEFDFIRSIRDRAAQQGAADLTVGIGDDAAAFAHVAGRASLITVDLLVEEIDFKLDYAVPAWLGHKSLAVSLSDIAAIGGAPRFALLTLAIPPHLKPQTSNPEPQTFWEEFFDGYFALAEAHNVVLIGGDISASPDKLTIDSIVLGECAAGRAVRRDGAQAGDDVYVTGRLGASAAGLHLLLDGARVDEAKLDLTQAALRAHLRPEPRVQFGRLLGEAGWATAMIDISDGLSQDLAQLCAASGVGAIIDLERVPVADELSLIASQRNVAFNLAVSGGEDYELLFTARREQQALLFELAASLQLELACIGEVTEEGGSLYLRHDEELSDLPVRGYDHLRSE